MFNSSTSVVRRRMPVVKVFLESNPQTQYSFTVPESKDWMEFLQKCAVKLSFKVASVVEMSLIENNLDSEENIKLTNLETEENMKRMKHGNVIRITCRAVSDSESSDYEKEKITKLSSDEEMREIKRFDVFCRVNHLRGNAQKAKNRLIKSVKRQAWKLLGVSDGYANFSNDAGQVLGIKKEIFGEITLPNELRLKDLQNKLICIILCHGGEFAACIFKGGQDVRHKTFSRYVVRKKQGGRQGARDQKAGSAGGWLRNFQEKKLNEEIIALFKTWTEDLNKCERIFIHAPGAINKKSIFAPESYFKTDDPRVLPVGITTHKPKFAEVKRVHHYYSTATLLE